MYKKAEIISSDVRSWKEREYVSTNKRVSACESIAEKRSPRVYRERQGIVAALRAISRIYEARLGECARLIVRFTAAAFYAMDN